MGQARDSRMMTVMTNDRNIEQTRIERDSLGERLLPAEALYGIHTLRAVENFPLSGQRIHARLIRALALVKKTAAQANADAGLLEPGVARAVATAADEVAIGQHNDAFLVDPLQGGAGTSTNMNANEVIANLAILKLGGRPGDYHIVHPLDHVNLSQSTNDVYPTAVRIAAIELLALTSDAFARLQAALQQKEAELAGVIKVGRTEMQDAAPVTLGQEFSAYAQAIARDRWRLYKVEERLRQVPLGGTVVGTGLNAPRRYAFLAIERLREVTGLGLARAENPMDVIQNADVFVEVSGLLKAGAVNLGKIANDLRLLSSGPRAGLGEISLPAVQAGSSIVPGKVNPVIAEALNQVAYQVMACDLAVTLGGQAGQLELNAALPLIAHNLFQELDLLRNGIHVFVERCLNELVANPERCRELLARSTVEVTALVPYLGYEAAVEVAQEAQRTGRAVREVTLARRLLSEAELDAILAPQELTRPGIPGAKALGKRPSELRGRPGGR